MGPGGKICIVPYGTKMTKVVIKGLTLHTCSLKCYTYSRFPDCLPIQLSPRFLPAGTFHGTNVCTSTLEISCWLCKICPESGQQLWFMSDKVHSSDEWGETAVFILQDYYFVDTWIWFFRPHYQLSFLLFFI